MIKKILELLGLYKALRELVDYPFQFATTFLVFGLFQISGIFYGLYFTRHPLIVSALFAVLTLLAAFCCKIAFRSGGTSWEEERNKKDDEIRELKEENIDLERNLESKAKENIEKDKELKLSKESLRQKDLHVDELKRRGIKVIDSERVFLLSLLKLQLSEVVHIDCLKENGKLLRFDRQWNNEKKIDSGVYRIITSVKINKSIYVGFELNEVRVLLDGKFVKYVLPPVKITSDIKQDNEEWMPEVMLSPERSILQKTMNPLGKPFGFYECEWKMLNPDVKKPATIVEDIQKIRTEMICGASSSLSIEKAKQEVKMLVKEQIIEKQIKFKGYEPVEEDSLPEGVDEMSLTDFVKRIDFVLPSIP